MNSLPPPAETAWDRKPQWVIRTQVGAAELDQFGHTNNVAYLAWLERVAWAHSESIGLAFSDYQRLGCGFVARRHELDYLLPTFGGQTLDAATWISENDGKLKLWRDYQILRADDGKTVLCARTLWICIDLQSGKPRRQPAEFLDKYVVAP